ncbi:cysteine hydrolase family protein [Niallia sp. FSL W8-0635]|uniref:cysteine hydrolase family protein n=1 Tax=Niallia sp. FSL W8-0635 TaxID=2975337 RepID=UPI0009C6A6A6|nr:isochorismatase hydrolase [Mycobacteroides abscessus subsp. abscessus]HEO8418782.1 cysteine hydrolase [Yersinia enterocolitica]HEO8422827.1 cysteine hydrolase [Yersinia enterocolitica]
MNQALLIIDVQQDLVNGTEQTKEIYNKQDLLKTINLVIKKAIKSEVEIIFVRDKDVAGGEGPGFDIHSDLNVPSEAKIFDKYATNAFYGTGLLEYLQSKEIQHLVIMGCETPYCIDTAVRTATVNQMDVTLVGDGHSTTDSPVLSAEKIIQHHNKILHGHYNVDHFSIVREAVEDLFTPTHDSYR